MIDRLTLLLLLTSFSCLAQKSLIRLNLKQDSTYYLTTNANVTVIEDIGKVLQVITIVISGRLSNKVTEIKDTSYVLELRYQGMAMHMDLAGRVVDFNSAAAGSQNPMSKIMASIINKPFTVVISKRGNVAEVRGTENLYSHMFDSVKQVTEAQKAQFNTQMQQTFGEKTIRSNFDDAFAVYPGNAIGINDQWTSVKNNESVITAKIKTTYTLKAINGTDYIIHGDAAIVSPNEQDYKPVNGFMMKYKDMTGTSAADYKVDKNTGWITEAKITKNIKGTADIKDTPQTPGGMTFPMSILGDVTMSGK